IGMHPAERVGGPWHPVFVVFRLIQPPLPANNFKTSSFPMEGPPASECCGSFYQRRELAWQHPFELSSSYPSSSLTPPRTTFCPLGSRKAVIKGSNACDIPCSFGLCCHSLPSIRLED